MKTDILFIRPACQMISTHPIRRPSIERSDWIFSSGGKNRRDETFCCETVRIYTTIRMYKDNNISRVSSTGVESTLAKNIYGYCFISGFFQLEVFVCLFVYLFVCLFRVNFIEQFNYFHSFGIICYK